MAPELYTTSHEHSYPSDWWAYGILAHELLTGRRPFKSDDFGGRPMVLTHELELLDDDPTTPVRQLWF